MSTIKVLQMPAFKHSYKKLHKNQKGTVNQAIEKISDNPHLGELKKGDLSGTYVYKFNIDHQEFLLAYEFDTKNRLLLMLSTHQNFYRNLKRLR